MSALPLVLLHGWGAHAGIWGDVIAQMNLGQTVIAPDVPGEAGPALEEVVARIAAAAPERCVAAGWSLGGQLALAWARHQPQQVAKLILISSTPRFVAAPDWPHGMDAAAFTGFAAEVAADPAAALRRFILLETQGDVQARAVARKIEMALAGRPAAERSVLVRTLNWLRDTDLRQALADIRQPALVLHGDRDRITPPGAGEYLARHLPDARLEIVRGAAHALFVSEPDAISRRFTEFCNE